MSSKYFYHKMMLPIISPQVRLEADLLGIFGIITADTIEQALERAGIKAGNKGWNAIRRGG